jgi:hypothetical protein
MLLTFGTKLIFPPISVAARSKQWVCGRLPADIVGSNPARAIEVFLLGVLCVGRWKSQRRTDHWYGGFLPIVVLRRV